MRRARGGAHRQRFGVVREMRRSGGRALHESSSALLDYYLMRSTKTHPRSSHENGPSHHRVKDALDQVFTLQQPGLRIDGSLRR